MNFCSKTIKNDRVVWKNKLIKYLINFDKMADTKNRSSLSPNKERILRHLVPGRGPNLIEYRKHHFDYIVKSKCEKLAKQVGLKENESFLEIQNELRITIEDLINSDKSIIINYKRIFNYYFYIIE